MSIQFNSKAIVVAVVCTALNVGVSSVNATALQSGSSSGSILLAQASGEDSWAAVGKGATMQDALGGGNPADIEAKKQAAEKELQAQQLAEFWEEKKEAQESLE